MSETAGAFIYPATPVIEQTDDYHGTLVADPYRWLESENAPETRRWIEEQNALTFGYLRSLPMREELRRRMTGLWNHPRYSPPAKRGGSYFYIKNDGLRNHGVLYRQQTLDSEPEAVLDPNTFSEDGTVALSALGIARNGILLAYSVSEGGSDWQTIFVRDMTTGKDLEDRVEWVKFSSITWTNDSRGFFYCRYPAPEQGQAYSQVNYNQTVCYHRVGTPQSEDAVVYSTPDRPEQFFYPSLSDDGRYLMLSIRQSSGPINALGFIDLHDPLNPHIDGPVRMLADEFDAFYDYVGNDGELFYIRTDKDAPRGCVVLIDGAQPAPEHRRTIIPETDETMSDVSVVGDRIYVTRLRNAGSVVGIFDLEGTFLENLAVPPLCTVADMRGKREDTEIFYLVTSYLLPSTIFRYDVRTGTHEPFHAPEIDFRSDDYETRQIWFESKDGVRVPMFVTCRKDVVLDGGNPTILYGYGGFNVSLTPAFSVMAATWLEQGGIYAVANLRGGGEFGDEWYRGGIRERKQNVFDDFIGAAETLIADGYTSPEHLAIMGGSNGGLLVGAVMTQRPDLIAAALPSVGVMDMLRYHLFTIGRAWASDYGTSSEPDMFPVLYAYSPLHNLKEGTAYPATLVVTGDHDDRVVPAHSFKFAARLQACQGGEAPVLIRIETRGGHGAGKPLAMIIEEAADELAFALAHTAGATEKKGQKEEA